MSSKNSGPPVSDPNLVGGVRQQSLQSKESHSFLWAGHLIHVDAERMVCSVAMHLGAAKEWHGVPLPAPAGAGPRCWAGCIPEPGAKVLINWAQSGSRSFRPQIVGFLTSGILPGRQYEPVSTVDPEEAKEALSLLPELADDPRYRLDVVRMKARKAYSGDFLASSSQGADFLLDRDSTLQNRAGNEFILRDSDQTSVLQTINEFVSSAAGCYRRGLIRRNAFNLLPDLFLAVQDRIPGYIGDKHVEDFLAEKTKTIQNEDGSWTTVLVDQIDPNSPAFEVLNRFGFVDSTGKVTIPSPSGADGPIYPFAVLPDGRRQSYIVHGTHDKRFDEVDECYVEDRADIYHTHSGVMSVMEEGDGVQIDNLKERVFIEDVKGTVVGNDPFSDAGRALYGKILSMSMFSSNDDMEPPNAELFAVDTAQSPSQADSIALARLFRIKPPTDDASEYTFGVTKEGRVFWNVPAARGSLQSVDVNTLGGVKAFLGPNKDRVSLNLKTMGGIKLDLGSFKDDSSDNEDSVSVDVILRGKLKIEYRGLQGRETTIAGTDYASVGGSHVVSAGAGHIVMCGGTSAMEAEGARRNFGTGGYAMRSLGSYDLTCLDKAVESFAKPRITTTYLGCTKMTVAGVDSTLVTAGSHLTTVASGAYAVTVGAGTLAMTCGAAVTMTSGAVLAQTAAGAASITAGGAITSTAAGANVMVGASALIQAPLVKIGLSAVGFVVAGAPGPPLPARDYITGIPLMGIPTCFIGP